METSLALVRHGQTDWNVAGRLQGRTDIELNDTGRAQARAVGRELLGQGWDLVLASPLGRAQETAQLIADELGVSTGVAVPGLIERGFGPLEGRIRAEVSDEEFESVRTELEPRDEILNRALPTLRELAKMHQGRKVLIVSHGATMRNIRDELVGETLSHGVENGEVIHLDLDRLSELVADLQLTTL